MDESDEDIDPLVGPVADLMAEHNLSSTMNSIDKPVEFIENPEEKIQILDYLSFLNIRLLFKDIFNYILDIQWYYYIRKHSPKIEQEVFVNSPKLYSSLKKLFLLFLIYAILTLSFPLTVHTPLIFYILYLLIVDFIFPAYIYYNWFQCLNSIRQFLNTIQIHQQWLIQIHGFQLIRPTSSLFENQLYQLRCTIFEELQKHFLYSRQIARQHSIENDQFICYIDLEEFGPLIEITNLKLDEITNKYDQISINSIFKLCHLQLNECIQLIHLNRPKTYLLFKNYTNLLLKSVENLNKIKQNCSIMIDYIDTEKSPSTKLISSYFLLRSNCEQLFEINEKDLINSEQLKRIIQDLKTVIYSLEAIQIKPNSIIDQTNSEQILSNDNNNPSNISSYHRFDDQIQESIDEILVCDTGKSNYDEIINNNDFNMNDYDQRLLREQTNCLMKELQTAIQGKKQEWNEREQRLLGNVDSNPEEDIQVEKEILDEQPFEKISSSSQSTLSMLDELKNTFVLNRNKLNIDEDIFGEDEIEDFDDDDDNDE